MSTPFYDLASLVVVPSGYKSGKIYAQKPLTTDGQLTFTRASTATRVNASGLIETVASGVPRLDYLGSTCPKLLLEPQRTNLLTYSEQFDNAAWVKDLGASVTANTTISPDGTQNADTLSVASGQYMYQNLSLTSGVTYIISVYLKVASGTKQFKFNTFGSSNDFTSSAYTATTSWQRFTYSFTAVGSGTTGIYPVLVDGLTGGDFMIWGAQVEAGAYATSYIPTTSAAVTRLADTYQKGGFGNTSTAGTLYYEFEATNLNSPNGQYLIQLFAGSSVGDSAISDSNSISIIGNGVTVQGRNNGYSTTLFTITPAVGATVKVALRYDGTNAVAFVNGVKQTVFADTSVGVKNAIRVNNGENGRQATKQILFFPTALTDAQAIELTTL